MADRFIDLLEYGFYGIELLLLATWRALPLLAIAALVDLCFRRRLAAKYHAALWSLVVLRLALPISLPSPWSLQESQDRIGLALLGIPQRVPRDEPIYELETRQSSLRVGERTIPPRAAPPPVVMEEPAPERRWGWLEIVISGIYAALLSAWALVAAGSILRGWFAHWRFARRLRHARVLDDARIVDLVGRECQSLKIRRRPVAKEVAGLAAPAVFGLFRSTICLPPNVVESLSDQELRWALRHELAHVRRRDAWTLTFASTMLSIHWINPFARLAIARLRSHSEAAADDLALASASADEARDYGRLLLQFAEQASSNRVSPALGLVPFASGRSLRGRIERLTQPRRPSRRWIGWTVAIATLMLGAVGLTDAAQRVVVRKVVKVPSLELVSPSLADDQDRPASPPMTSQKPPSLKSYDVAPTLERIAERQPEVDASEFLLSACRDVAPNRSLSVEQGRLVANADADQHRALGEMLAAWNAGGPQRIQVAMRIMVPDLAVASSIDWTSSRIYDVDRKGRQPLLAAKITEGQLIQLLRRLQGMTRSGVFQAPAFTIFNGQSLTYADLDRTPFVTDVKALADGSWQPVIEVFDEGLEITAQPVTTGDGTVDLTFRFRAAAIEACTETNLPYAAPQGTNGAVAVQVPDVSESSLGGTTRLAPGESVLIAMPQISADPLDDIPDRILYCAITPYFVDAK